SSNSGAINTSAGSLDASSTTMGGAIALTALSDITLGADNAGKAISTEGGLQGGSINLTSSAGSIAAAGSLDTSSAAGIAGNVNLIANGDINIQNIRTQGQQQGGNASIIGSGLSNFNLGIIDTTSAANIAGNVEFSTGGQITTNGVNTQGLTRAGDITMTSGASGITANGPLNTSSSGLAGGVTLQAAGNIVTSAIRSTGNTQSGDINITSNTGDVIAIGDLDASSSAGIGADVNLTALSNIATGNIQSFGPQQSGNVSLISMQGDINTGRILTQAPNGTLGEVAFSAVGSIDTGLITAQGFQTVQQELLEVEIELDSDPVLIVEESSDTSEVGTKEEISDLKPTNLDDRAEATSVSNGLGSDNTGIGELSDTAPETAIDNSRGSDNASLETTRDSTKERAASESSGGNDAGFGTPRETAVAASDGENGDADNAGLETANDTPETSLAGEGDTSRIIVAINRSNYRVSNPKNTTRIVTQLEAERGQEFSDYFGQDLTPEDTTAADIRQTLVNVERQTGNRSAAIYVSAPETRTDKSGQPSSPLEILVFTTTGPAISLEVPEVSREELFETVNAFRGSIVTSFRRRRSKDYLKSAQKLYRWLIAPIEAELGPDALDTLLFSMDTGLRSLPIAALHDGQQFLVEKYSLGMVPTVGLVDTRYRPLVGAQVLAMGASTFVEQHPLPAVPTELRTIAQLWSGSTFLNEDFTRKNLMQQRQETPYQIVHLATHAQFNPGTAANSYIQLWDEKLRLNQVQELNWDQPAVDLLVLSACRTAIGNPEAELGFAGLAVVSGVRSVLASIWSVSDTGTLALMSEFYDQLRNSEVKSEALRQAQLTMLRGEKQIKRGHLQNARGQRSVKLPLELAQRTNIDLSHPYYWSGFTMIGSPW
ncbi:MAG: CHAT domain-containing protein, partial [Cyanothece sp. SIO1E1]|nr:CHAT domain-containing protein [Cyanothece sp. SIO1E1]